MQMEKRGLHCKGKRKVSPCLIKNINSLGDIIAPGAFECFKKARKWLKVFMLKKKKGIVIEVIQKRSCRRFHSKIPTSSSTLSVETDCIFLPLTLHEHKGAHSTAGGAVTAPMPPKPRSSTANGAGCGLKAAPGRR